jgi:hypothetical protein
MGLCGLAHLCIFNKLIAHLWAKAVVPNLPLGDPLQLLTSGTPGSELLVCTCSKELQLHPPWAAPAPHQGEGEGPALLQISSGPQTHTSHSDVYRGGGRRHILILSARCHRNEKFWVASTQQSTSAERGQRLQNQTVKATFRSASWTHGTKFRAIGFPRTSLRFSTSCLFSVPFIYDSQDRRTLPVLADR